MFIKFVAVAAAKHAEVLNVWVLLLADVRGCFLTSSLAAALSLTLTIPMSAIADIFVSQVDLTVTTIDLPRSALAESKSHQLKPAAVSPYLDFGPAIGNFLVMSCHCL